MQPRKTKRRRSVTIPNYRCDELESRTLLSAAYLLKDINTNTVDSFAHPIGTVGTTLYFQADDGVHGNELYTTTGIPASTHMVTDLAPGSANGITGGGTFGPGGGSSFGAILNSLCYFASPVSGGLSLYKSNGTAAGTTLVKQLASVSGEYAYGYQVVGSKLLFDVQDTSGNAALWVSDGTANGTVPLSQVIPAIATWSISSTLAVGNKLYFVGGNYSSGTGGLYATDGTAAGTTLVAAHAGQQMFSAGSKVLFITIDSGTSSTVWSTDGTVAGTISLKSFQMISSYGSGATRAYFMAYNATTSTYELYTTTGTVAGTTLVKGGFGFPRQDIGVAPDGSAYFVANTNPTIMLFHTDGTAAGTVSLGTLDEEEFQNFEVYPTTGGVLFAAYDGNGHNALYKSNGTAVGTVQIPINNYGNPFPQNFYGTSPTYFTAADGTHGSELWKTDGTAAGTSLVADINLKSADSNPTRFTLINNRVWFSATDPNGFQEPYVSDGSRAGTYSLTTTPGTINYRPIQFVGLGANMLFNGSGGDISSQDLYVYNGSTITRLNSQSSQLAGVNSLTSFGGDVYMAAGGTIGTNYLYNLWRTDGTTGGTGELAPTIQLFYSDKSFPVIGSTMFFEGVTGQYGNALYSMTAGGVMTLCTTGFEHQDILADSVIVGNKLYFVAYNNGGRQLWQSDGTVAGTSLVMQLTGVQQDTPYAVIAASGGVIYIGTSDPANTNNTELFRSDGTTAGTTLITTIAGMDPYTIGSFVSAGGQLFLTGAIPAQNYRTSAWRSDGTAAGTIDLFANTTANPSAGGMVVDGNLIVFTATDPLHGQELWETEGLVADTRLALDINPGTASGNPGYMTQLGNAIFLSVNDGTDGSEPMLIFDQDTIAGTSGTDVITLTQLSDHANIAWQVGSVSGVYPIGDPVGLTILGDGGSDAILLNYTNGNPLPTQAHLSGTFTLNGLTGTNPLANTTLDIGNSTLFIPYANAAADNTLRTYLKNGYNAGAWNSVPTSTTGVITSAAAAADITRQTTIGYLDSADGIGGLPANTLELRYTYYGDTGLAGSVSFTDFMRMTQHYKMSGMTWAKGDFNFDGTVNAADFALLNPNYGLMLPTPAPAPASDQALASAPPSQPLIISPSTATGTIWSNNIIAAQSITSGDTLKHKGKVVKVRKPAHSH